MNSKRENFDMPSSHSFRITPYWILGLIEGDGSFGFSITNNKIIKTTFYLSLTASQAPLINAIKDKLDSMLLINHNQDIHLPAESKVNLRKLVGVYTRDSRGGNAKPSILVSQIKFIVEILILALYSLNFMSKKYMDFLD